MTYQEALAEKLKTEQELKTERELKESQPAATLIIAPQLMSDQKEFMAFYTEDNYKDDLCLLFSSNDQYTVLISIK